MSDKGRVQQLLEELLDHERTPEEVCAGDPNLLAEVRARWARVRRVADQLDDLFPSSDSLRHPELVPGDGALPEIAGYHVEAVLGRGGMGVVFKAQQLKPGRPVALKMLLAGGAATRHERARFLREVEAAATLRHPNIVQLYAVGDHDGRPYFTMELVEGGTLAQHLARERPAPRRAAELVAALAVTVQFAHKSGIVHRDLKPANILLTAPTAADQAPWGAPKIADFGLARFLTVGPELTHTGARLGTPSYMAPEQALGRTAEIGPATDVYALGAILYETFTGRPPFVGATAVETERLVISEEPPPPSRANPHVPRDLETICLKALHKNPARRYASAQDLADDLHRFLDGKPVAARPVGAVERAVKWGRRRPALALLLAALLALLGTAVGAGAWFEQQRADRRAAKAQQQERARGAVGTALRRVDELRRQERWRDAKLILAEAEAHLATAESAPLEKQFRQTEADIRLASDLDRARENLFLLHPASTESPHLAAEYQHLFDRAGLRLGDDWDTLAASIRASAVRPQIVAALDDWAYVMHKLGDDDAAARLLHLTRTVDPEPRWRDPFRDTKVWKQRDRLRHLADTAFTTAPPPPEQQLALLGLLLREQSGGYRNTQLLARACRRYPNNFWLAREMGDACFTDGREQEAIGYYRAALAVRPESARVYAKLGQGLFRIGRIDEGLAAHRRAVALTPTAAFRVELVRALAGAGYWKEAAAECRAALEADPTSTLAPSALAGLLAWNGRTDEALALFRKAAEIGASDFNTQSSFAEFLVSLNRHGEAIAAFRRALELEPKQYSVRHRLAHALATAGRADEALAEYRTVIASAPHSPWYRTDYAALLRAQGRSEEALAVLQEATSQGTKGGVLWGARAAAELDQGNFAQARAATERELGTIARDSPRFKLCESLLAIERRLPALLAGQEQPADATTALALAEWCWNHRRLTATSACFYATAFALDPALIANAEVSHRFCGACAAVLAGSGVGKDAAVLGDRRRAELRAQALDWLAAEYGAWAEWLGKGGPGSKSTAARAMRSWQESRDLAAVRDEKALAALPPDERQRWQALWAKVGAIVDRDPATRIAQAQTHAARREWEPAAACFAVAFALEPTDDGELWFEYAACQLLSGDRAGYRRSCAHMLARGRKTPSMRAYLVARACTLAPGSTTDPTAPWRAAHPELASPRAEFWALTELGALHVREKQCEAAVARLEDSLLADDRPGRAVLNWLWLALAHQQSNNTDEARRCLNRATEWLDQQEGRMPRDLPEMGSHLHNWLEAHALRREAESLLAPRPENRPHPTKAPN